MNGANYEKTFQALQLDNKYLKIFSGALLVICLLQAFKIVRTKPVFVMAPSTMDAEMTIGSNYASRDFYAAWGMFIANTVGNVNPRNGDFLIAQIAPLFHSSIYQEAVDVMSDQITAISLDRITYTFEPETVTFESDKRDITIEDGEAVQIQDYSNDRVYVTGTQIEQGPIGEPVRREVTYEMEFDVFNYLPRILVLDNYEGRPRTTKINQSRARAEEAKERVARERDQ